MSTQIVLFLPESLPPTDSTSPVLQHLVTHDGHSVARQSATPLSLLHAQGRSPITAIAPIARLSWQRVQLPKGTLTRKGLADTARLRAVLSGAMEDRLLDAPEALHFALEPQPRDGEPCTVAVCDRAWLRAWMRALEENDCVPERIVPELPPPQQTLHIFARGDQAWAAWSTECSLAMLPFDIESARLMQWPTEAAVLAEPALAAQAQQVLSRRVGLLLQTDRWLAAAGSHWDLAQLEWASVHARRRWRRIRAWLQELRQAPRWRVARWMAAAVVAVNLAGLNAWAWRLRSNLQTKQEQIASILQQSFPAVKVIVDAPVQMRKELKLRQQANGHSGPDDAETLLTAAASIGGSPPSAIDYEAGQLRLRGWAVADAELASARHRLATQGIDLSLQDSAVVLRAKEGTP